MKSLQESLLDDDEELFNDTDTHKQLNIPDIKDFSKVKSISSARFTGYTYEWITPIFKEIIDDKHINMDITGLYVYWIPTMSIREKKPHYRVLIKPRIGKSTFNHNAEFFGVSSYDDKKYSSTQAKKIAYSFIKCMSEHPIEILKIILNAHDKNTWASNWDSQNYVYIEDIINEYS